MQNSMQDALLTMSKQAHSYITSASEVFTSEILKDTLDLFAPPRLLLTRHAA